MQRCQDSLPSQILGHSTHQLRNALLQQEEEQVWRCQEQGQAPPCTSLLFLEGHLQAAQRSVPRLCSSQCQIHLGVKGGLGRDGVGHPRRYFFPFLLPFAGSPSIPSAFHPGAQQLPLGRVAHRAAPARAITLRDIASSPSCVVRRGGHPSLLPF